MGEFSFIAGFILCLVVVGAPIAIYEHSFRRTLKATLRAATGPGVEALTNDRDRLYIALRDIVSFHINKEPSVGNWDWMIGRAETALNASGFARFPGDADLARDGGDGGE